MSDLQVKRLLIARVCADEIISAAEHYRTEGGDDLAQRCANEIGRHIRQARKAPLAGAPIARAPFNWRRKKIRRFPYHLYYTLDYRNDTLYVFWLCPEGQREIPTISKLRRIANERKADVVDLRTEEN
jgi:plasmid stabilization system protein ParE